MILTCEFCKKQFIKKRFQKFCSTECASRSRIIKKYTELCEFCGKPLGDLGWTKRFCNRTCASKYGSSFVKREKIAKKCNRCEKEFIRENNYKSLLCPDCKKVEDEKIQTIKAMTIREYLAKNAQYKEYCNKYSGIRYFCRNWLKHLKNKPCQNCGYSKHTEFCHIKEINKNLDMTIGEINDESNILILCKNCHWKFDHGYLTLDILQKSC